PTRPQAPKVFSQSADKRIGRPETALMEFTRLINVERLSGRLPPEQREGEKVRRKEETSEKSRPTSPQRTGGDDEAVFSAPINFEYLPSGKLQVNQEIKQQLIDLFE
ncbi:MAG TPA: hypothetical protein P5568_06420, partial [Acidobacteriota bacterium]|nr:hypothetical protein [Acidobacteriota bacterium]